MPRAWVKMDGLGFGVMNEIDCAQQKSLSGIEKTRNVVGSVDVRVISECEGSWIKVCERENLCGD